MIAYAVLAPDKAQPSTCPVKAHIDRLDLLTGGDKRPAVDAGPDYRTALDHLMKHDLGVSGIDARP